MKPIRLLMFVKAFYIGGTEVQVLELLRGLPRDRYEIDVAVVDEVGPLLEDVWKLGYLPRAFPLKGSFLSPTGAMQIARLAAWMNERRHEVVHAQDFYSTLLAVPAARLVGAKTIVGRLDLLHWHGRWRSAGLKQLTRMADHVIANADAVKRFVIEREQIPEERISVIRNGLDLARFDARRDEPLHAPLPDTGGQPFALHLANMSHPVKRQEDLLHAMKKVPGFHAFFVGDGPRRPTLEKLASELGLDDRAHFLGFRKDTPAIQARAAFGVLSSEAEGLSNAIIEGMASSLPMIVTDVGGNPELVRDGERGLVVPPRNPDALAAAISTILSDRDRATAMGRAARAFVERELSLSRLISDHDRLYRKLARENSARDLLPRAAIA